MKTALLIAAFLTTIAAPAAASSCGLPPLPPLPEIGCRRMEPVCQCNDRGDCYWVFVCVPRR